MKGYDLLKGMAHIDDDLLAEALEADALRRSIDAFLAAWCVAFLRGEGADAAMRRATELSAYVAGHKGAMC